MGSLCLSVRLLARSLACIFCLLCVCVCVSHVTASSAGSSRRLFFVRMFFNPSFTKPSHVASVLGECLEMASRRCLLAVCAGRSSSPPFFRPPVPPLHHGLLDTSFSIRLALPFRIVPFALHSVTSMAVLSFWVAL